MTKERMMNDELPEGWGAAPLGQIVEINPKSDHPNDMEVGFVAMPFIGKGYLEPVRFESKQWKDVKKGYTHFLDGDVLLAKITPCFENGKGALVTGLPNGSGAGSTEYFVCRTRSEALRADYLHAFFKTPGFMAEAETQMSGSVGHKRVPKEHISETPIPLAPLAEQKRIADKLEAVLGRVDACRARLDRVPALLKRFRQSVLAAATSGQLTEDWRHNNSDVSNKEAQAETREITEKYFAPSSWEPASFEALTEMITSGSRGWADYYSLSGAIFIRAQNINSDRLNLEDVAYVALPKQAEGKRAIVERDDLLVTITGANVGKSARVQVDLAEAYISQHIALIKLKDQSLAAFLELFLWAENAGRDQLNESAYGGGKPGLNLQNIRDLCVALPPLPEQTEIVRRVEALFALADRIEARLATAQRLVERLTPATLSKAFRGELVPQDPNDEPAAKLLERLSTSNHPPPRRKKP